MKYYAVKNFLSKQGNWVVAYDTPIGQSNGDLIERINRYRNAGFSNDGLHTLQGYQVDDLDYQLMGSDNSCAFVNNPDISKDEIIRLNWFAINKNANLAKKSFGNSHGTSYDNGKTYLTESALMDIPKTKYQCAPEEVAWHHTRLNQLKLEGAEQPERVRIMTADRASKPWLKSLAA